MDAKALATVKEKLLERRQHLEMEMKDVASGAVVGEGASAAAFPDYGSGEDDNTAEVATFTTNLSLEKVLAQSLRDIDSALVRIEKGTYGVCKYCGKEIDARRLIARPASSSCISCKESMKARP